LSHFITRKNFQISADGWFARQFRIKRLVLLPFKLLNIFFAFLFVLLIRILRLFVTVRIGRVDVGRIGGIYIGDWYLSEKAYVKHQGRYLDFFYFTKSTNHVNWKWEKMWRHVLPSVPGTKFWEYSLRLNRLIPKYEEHEIPFKHVYPDLRTWQAYLSDSDDGKLKVFNERLSAVLKNKNSNISFKNEEEKQGQIVLESIGVTKNKQYICFHSRDSTYLETVNNGIDCSFHNYRDSDIKNYIPAAEEMANRGYYAIRMGAVVKESIHSSNSWVIDYATSGQRSEYNDIYIGSHCRFFLSSDGGMSAIPEMFRIPAVYVNWTAILRISTWVLNGLFIFKKFYLKSENRYMSFSEIMNFEFGGRDTNEIFAKMNLELIENTPEEIRAVTIEMDERINGSWETSKEDEELQDKFWSLFGPGKIKSHDLRIGSTFLKQNIDLIK